MVVVVVVVAVVVVAVVVVAVVVGGGGGEKRTARSSTQHSTAHGKRLGRKVNIKCHQAVVMPSWQRGTAVTAVFSSHPLPVIASESRGSASSSRNVFFLFFSRCRMCCALTFALPHCAQARTRSRNVRVRMHMCERQQAPACEPAGRRE